MTARNRCISRGNFYSTPSPPTQRGHSSRSSPEITRSSSSSSSSSLSSSTPLSSRDSVTTLQQVIAGLAACQSSIQVLLKTVESSNERINDLSEKMKSLDDKVVKLSSDQAVDFGRSSTNGKRKRTKASLLIEVSVFLLIFLE